MALRDNWGTLLGSTAVVESPREEGQEAKDEKPIAVIIVQEPLRPLKGHPQTLLSNESVNRTSDKVVDCRSFNRVHVDVSVTGTTPSVTITVMGILRGSPFVAVPDSNGTQTGVSASTSFDCIVGMEEITVRLTSISGTYGSQQGFTVIVTPYVG